MLSLKMLGISVTNSSDRVTSAKLKICDRYISGKKCVPKDVLAEGWGECEMG